MNEFEQQFEQDKKDPRAGILQTLMALSEMWPDVLSTWENMVDQAIASGWEPIAARALVLSTVTDGNLALFASLPNEDE